MKFIKAAAEAIGCAIVLSAPFLFWIGCHHLLNN